MAAKTNFVPKSGAPTPTPNRFRLRALFYLTVEILLLFALWSYTPADGTALEGGSSQPLTNWVGGVGAWSAGVLYHLFGLASWVMLAGVTAITVRGLIPGGERRHGAFWGFLALSFGAILLFALVPGIFAESLEALGLGSVAEPESGLSGGVIGQVLVAPPIEAENIPSGILRHLLGTIGVAVIGWLLLTLGAVLIYLARWRHFISWQKADAAAGSLIDTVGNILARAPAPAPTATEAAKAPAPEPAPTRETKPAISGEDVPDEREPGAFRKLLGSFKPFRRDGIVPHDGEAAEPTPETAPATMTAAVAAALETAPVPEPDDPPETVPAAATPSPMSAGAMSPTAQPMPGFSELKPELPTDTSRSVHRNLMQKLAAPYVIPPISMLTKGENSAVGEDPQTIADAKNRLQNTLVDFGVNGNVIGHLTGPQVTRYEISLAPGVAVSKVSSISDNILMNMQTQSIRILAPIPGKNVVGVEVPNSRRETITLRSIFESEEWLQNKGEMPVVLGKNVSGKPVVADLTKAPHLLIAGATGSGKSVCVNSLIMSLLFRFRPDELRLILVDPKVVEFTFYQSLPFLITPVINESNKALLALRWAVNEMEKRYRMLAKVHTRNIKEYNGRSPGAGEQLDDDGLPLPEKLPYLVIIVDEFADLMMGDRNVRKDVETAISRIAQKGRAAGIHIVLATQRPSRDVLTGIIKANLPTKIALRVGSQVDSRVIVDAVGAERLLGHGDMLFLPPSSPMLERIQGTWVSNAEIEKVVSFISEQAKPEFNQSVVADPDDEEEEDESAGKRGKGRKGRYEDEEDEFEPAPDLSPVVAKYLKVDDDKLVREALEIILSERQASTSYLQRRLRLGYNRAADLIDEFERRGIIGPARDGGNKREILVFDEITGE